MKNQISNSTSLFHDIVLIIVGVVLAIFLSKSGAIDFITSFFRNYYIIASFFTGIFFTSVFTLAPASVALVHIAEYAPSSSVALWGGLGAMCGDLILFFFIRDRFYDDLLKAIRPKTIKYILHSLHFGFLKWLSPIVGALIIASPLPDEFGVALLGMSKVKTAVLVPISLIMNIFGIYLLLGFADIFL